MPNPSNLAMEEQWKKKEDYEELRDKVVKSCIRNEGFMKDRNLQVRYPDLYKELYGEQSNKISSMFFENMGRAQDIEDKYAIQSEKKAAKPKKLKNFVLNRIVTDKTRVPNNETTLIEGDTETEEDRFEGKSKSGENSGNCYKNTSNRR